MCDVVCLFVGLGCCVEVFFLCICVDDFVDCMVCMWCFFVIV